MSINQDTILLADDDEDGVILVKMACKRSRLTNPLQIVTDGARAIEYLAGNGKFADRTRFPLPGFLLLDIKMPKKDGFDVLSWIRSHPALKRLPVIFFSSSRHLVDINRAYDL